MKKILFVINTMGQAGAETAMLGLMQRLLQTGEYQLFLYVILPQGELFGRLPAGVQVLNPHCSTESVLSPKGRLLLARSVLGAFFRHGTGFGHLGSIAANLRAQKRTSGRIQPDKALWRLLADAAPPPPETYDLAIAYIEGASTYFLADKVRAVHKAAFVHIDYPRAGYTPQMDAGCYDRIDRIFAVSDEVRTQFCSVYPQYAAKIFLFRNLLDADYIRRQSLASGFTDAFAGPRIVTIGRLHYQKACDVAIEACAKIVQDGFDVRWYVFGEGPERPKLEKQIRECGLTDRFFLCGAVANPYPYLRQAALYVHATRYEGKSIAVEEAQILGKTILASDCTGNREQICSGVDGLLFPLSAENIADAVETVLRDPALGQRLAQQAARKDLHHPEDLQRLLELLESPQAKERNVHETNTAADPCAQ